MSGARTERIAVCGLAFVTMCFTSPVLACNNWNIGGQQEIHQGNHIPVVAQINQYTVPTGIVLDGSARYYSMTLGGVVPGSLSGKLNGTHLSIKIDWSAKYPTGRLGVYEGDIDSNGRVTGFTWNEINPVSTRTSWWIDRIACADPPAGQYSLPSNAILHVLPGASNAQPQKRIVHIRRNPPAIPGGGTSSSGAPGGDTSAGSSGTSTSSTTAPGGDSSSPDAPGGSAPSTDTPAPPPASVPAAQDVLSGQWQGKVAYDFQQTASGFTWWSQDLQERATGTIDGDTLTVNWTGPNGNGGMQGHIVERDAGGRATRIRWSNGQLWLRVN